MGLKDVAAGGICVTIRDQEICRVTGGWGRAILLWGAVHVVFAVIPKMKNVLYLVQEKCFGIKERSLPSKAAKVVEYYGLQ